MKIRAFLKTLLFAAVFYAYTAFCCFFLVFTFALPRRPAFRIVRKVYFKGIAVIERLFLGLDFRVTGRENLPKNGSYILALKHYSTYETLKLPVIFGDIAIILKRELSWIPFWGWYTIKLGMIPVDRGAGHKAIHSLIENSRQVIADGRPILIFPQGTRVDTDTTTAERPYKIGAAKIAETLKLPVVPVALNSGAFWPKHSFIIQGGVVEFKILPPLPADLPATEIMHRLEAALEPESAALVKGAKIDRKGKHTWRFWPRWVKPVARTTLIVFALWAAWWYAAAWVIGDRLNALAMQGTQFSSPYRPEVSGFPGALHILWPQITLANDTGRVETPMFEARVWPVPAGRGTVALPQGFTATGTREGRTYSFSASMAALHLQLPVLWRPREAWAVTFTGVEIASGDDMGVRGEGEIPLPLVQKPINGQMAMHTRGHGQAIDLLVGNGIVPEDQARIARAFLDAMAAAQGGGGSISFPISIKDDVVYLSMIRLFTLERQPAPAQAGQSAEQLQKIRSGDWVKDVLPAPMLQMQPLDQQP